MTQNHENRGLLFRLFPFLSWLRGYGVATFRIDAVAGLTVAVVLIPQSMAYAMLAGLPPVYGLYAAAVTPMVAALWGSLRQLATGPIAIMSLLVLTSLTPLAEPGSPRFIELALLLSLLVGILYLGIGLFRMGILMAFISHSAVKGFTSAAALIITATQLPHFLGISMGHHESVVLMAVELVKHIPSIHPPTLAIGIVAFVIIYGLKKIKNTLPAGLIAMTVTTLAVVLLGLDDQGVAIVGETASGLPAFHLPPVDPDYLSDLLGPAIVIALVSFAETYSVGKAISGETKQKLDVDQEFIGQGLANLVGAFFQSYPVSGSFSRSAINFAAGAKTGISSVISSFGVIIALLFLTPLLTHIPKAALAALVISAVLMLFHPRAVFALWRMNRHDGIVAVTVFVLALLTKPDYALLIGVVVSLMFFLWKTMHPRIVRISRDPELEMFVNADTLGQPSCPQILQLRSDNAIYFANAEYTIEHIIKRLDEQETPVQFLLLDFQAMGFIDVTGVDELRMLLEEIRGRGMALALMEVRQPVVAVLESTGFLAQIQPGHLFQKRGDAISFLFQRIDHGYCRKTCPHRLFIECGTVK
ncbi:MAG: sulfate permease [Desulfobacterales bacterium]|nr:sulfate permease [Desulfobacterales bacterium]